MAKTAMAKYAGSPRTSLSKQFMRAVAITFATLLVIVCVVLIAGVAWLNTAHAREFLVSFAAKQLKTPERELIITAASGSLLSTIEIEQLVYRNPGIELAVSRLRLQWSVSELLSRKLLLTALDVGPVTLELKQTNDTPPNEPNAGVPNSLALPIDFELKRFSLSELSVKTAGAADPLVFANLGFAIGYERANKPHQFALTDVTATTPWGQLQDLAISMGDAAPFALDVQGQWQGPVAEQTLNVDLTGSGSLEDFALTATAIAGSGAGSARVSAQAQPLNPVPWKTLDVRLESFDLQAFDPQAPRTSVDAQLKLANLEASSPDINPEKRKMRDRLQASLTMVNRAPGLFSAARLPIRGAAMTVVAAYRDDPAQGMITIADLDLGLSAQSAVNQSRITGDIKVDLSDPIQIANQTLPAITGTLSFNNIDANQWIDTIPPTALVGSLALSRHQLELQLNQSEEIPFEPPAGLSLPIEAPSAPPSIQVQVSAKADQLRIDEVQASFNDTLVDVKGQAALSPPYEVSIDGALENLKLENWLTAEQQAASPLASGELNADFSVNGPTLAPAQTNVKLRVFDSLLGGKPLITNLDAMLTTEQAGGLARVSAVNASLSLGKNQLKATGALGESNDVLALTGQLGALSAFDNRLAGDLNLDANLTGAFDALRARLNARGSKLKVAQSDSALSLQGLELTADLPIKTDPGPDEVLSFKVTANRFKSGDTEIRRAQLTVEGTPKQHTYDASVSSGPWAGRIKGRGKALLDNNPSWATTIRSFDVAGKLKARLRSQAKLAVSAEEINLQALQLVSGAGRVTVDQARVQLGETPDLSVSASARNLIVSDILSAVSSIEVPAELSRLRAQANIELAGSGAEDLSGRVSLDLDEKHQPRDPPAATVAKTKLGIQPGRVLDLAASSGKLTGRLALELPSLEFSHAYTGDDLQVDGAISLRGDIGGTTNKPTWIAKIKGADLAVLQRSVGWRLDRGVLNATITPKQIELTELKIASGDGSLAISGSARIPSGPRSQSSRSRRQTLFNGRFVIEPNRFVVPIGPGQRIAVSGKTILQGAHSGIDLSGDILVDEGVIEVQGSGAPSAPSDLVFVDEQPEAEQAADAADTKGDDGNSPEIKANLNIDTGQNLRVVGSGIRARLVGKLKLGGVLPASPRLTGRVDVSDGSYRAYGQALDIKRGIVRFNGPADNPNLDILAIRPALPVEVGVSVNGTAAVPTIELVSTPELPNAEKLSWLVLGAGLDSAPGAAQSLALQQAAKSLVGADNSDEQGGIAERLGFDSLGLGYASDTGPQQGVTDSGGPKGLPGSSSNSGSVTAEEVVTVGRQLSSKVRISYEQGLRGVQNLLRIQYDVSKRLAVRAQTGSDNAVDLLYFFSFD